MSRAGSCEESWAARGTRFRGLNETFCFVWVTHGAVSQDLPLRQETFIRLLIHGVGAKAEQESYLWTGKRSSGSFLA